jgi:hypothetical protein
LVCKYFYKIYFKKNQNGANDIMGAQGKMIHEENRSQNSRGTVPLKTQVT